MRNVPKWKTLAARTASAPASTAGPKCSSVPAPPDARRPEGPGRPRPARRDDGHRHDSTHGAGQLEVVAGLGAVGVHRVEQDLSDTELLSSRRPLHGIDAGSFSTTVSRDFETGRRTRGSTRIDGQHDALRTEAFGSFAKKLRAGDRSGVERDLVRAGAQEPVDVLDAADPAPDRERDEDLFCRTPDDVVRRVPAVAGRGDVEEHQLVGALAVVDLRHLHRVTGVAQVLEVDAFHYPARVDIQTRDDPDGARHGLGSSPTPAR